MSDYLHFFTESEADAIVAAIAEAEMRTSGELRVHVENRCKGDAMARALAVFTRLGMHDTRDRNGVLFYLSTEDHHFAIIGDKGIHDKVGDDYWQGLKDKMQLKFRSGEFSLGLIEAISTCGQSLARFFPRSADDVNELSDSISSQRN